MKQKVVIGFLASLFTLSLSAVSIVGGSSTTAGETFATAILSNVYHQPSKTWYTGMTNGNTTYAIGKVGSTGGFTSAVANNDTTDNIRLLTLSHNTNNVLNPLLIFSATDTNSTEPTTLYSQVAGDSTRNQVVDSSGTATNINDANATAATTNSIRAITAGNSYAFAAVRMNTLTADVTTFGSDTDDGIALMTIDHTTKKLTVTNATDGSAGNRALNVGSATVTITNAPASFDGDVCMHWDEFLQRLYVGVQNTTDTGVNDSCYGIIIYRVDSNGALQTVAPVANAATTIEDNTRIVASRGTSVKIAILKLNVMRTSTGFSYLIIQGGNAVATSVRRLVYAVPLVYTAADTGNLNGSLADINVTTFITQASGTSDLYTNSAVTSPQASVGNGILPIDNAATTEGVSDMKVIGDTVYCSTYDDTLTNAPGVYYSQAIFDENGNIARWTDWAKAAPEELGNSTTDGSVGHFAVDATHGTIIASDKDTDQIVRRTAWTKTGNTNSLVSKLNTDLSDGCFSVFDLNQSTVNFGTVNDDPFNRYALFGGRGKVAFAKVSTGASAEYTAAETVITDFSGVGNYLLTTISGDTAPVKVLGYSKWTSGTNPGFFFAGTKNGFYVYATTADGTGHNPASFGNLDVDPFDGTFSWRQLTAISGEPRAIKCIGLDVYILTRDTTKLSTLTTTTTNPTDRLYGIASSTDFDSFTVSTLATTETGGLANATILHDFEIITANGTGTAEQIILCTNDGLYKSNTGVTANTWTQITNPVTDNKIYDFITAPTHNRVPQKTWVAEWLDNSSGDGIWTFSGLRQLVNEDTITAITGILDDPNATFNSDSSTNFTRLSPIKKLWSDGARRMYIGIPENSDGRYNKLYALPFNVGTSDWNLTGEQQITDATVQEDDNLYWVQAIGATGNIMVGTDSGVISLE